MSDHLPHTRRIDAHAPDFEHLSNELRGEVWEAAHERNNDRLKKLVIDNPDLLVKPVALGGTILELVARYDNLEMIEFLLDQGMHVDQVWSQDRTALNAAIRKGKLNAARYLVERGANVNIDERSIIGAINADENQLELVKLLVENGARLNERYSFGPNVYMTNLSWASDHPEIAEYLRSKGALTLEELDNLYTAEHINFSESTTTETSGRDKIIDHIAAQDGPIEQRCMTHIVPPCSDVSIAVHVIRPRADRDHFTLFTTGMSDAPMSVPEDGEEYRYAELLINLPADWKLPEREFRNDDYHWPFEWLFKMAYYPHLQGSWLGGPFVIVADEEPPQPLAGNTKLSCMLLVADKSDWGRVKLENDKEVFFYTLMPLYTAERNLEIRRGIPELIRHFHVHDIPDVVDLERRNVAKQWWQFWR